MFMDIAQEAEQEPKSDEEDTVYDRTNPFHRKNPFEEETSEHHGMLDEQDTRCGLGSWRPQIMQKCANKTVFSVLFTLVGIIQGSYWTYYTANISTVEKRFGMDSTTSGVLLFVNELAQVLMTVLLTYFGFRRQRARVLVIGLALSSLSCFLMASPHYFLGSGDMAMSVVKSDDGTSAEVKSQPRDVLRSAFVSLEQNSTEVADMIEKITSENPTVDPSSTIMQSTLSSSEPSIASSSIQSTEEVNSTKMGSPSSPTESSSSPSSTLPPVPAKIDSTNEPSDIATTEKDSNHIPEENLEQTTTPFPYVHDTMKTPWPMCNQHAEMIDGAEKTEKTCSRKSFERKFTFAFIFIANFIGGVGAMMFLISGGPFAEDPTILPNELPRIFGISMSIRLIGTFFGYLFAWSCLHEFINPMSQIVQTDSRWLGAYWLGWTCLGICMAIFAFVFSLFPRQSPKEFLKKRSLTHESGVAMLMIPNNVPFFGGAELKTANPFPSILNIPTVAQALLRNKVYAFLSLSTMVHVFVGVGYSTFLPKYLEFMFRLKASDASALTGVSSVPFQVAGLMIGGAFISRYLPSPREIAHWNALITGLQIVCLMVLAFFGCSTDNIDISFLKHAVSSNESSAEPMHCSAGCDCETGPLLPVCDSYTGKSFYSPCHGGCEKMENLSTFSECLCLSHENITVTEGFCPSDNCSNGLVEFLVLVCVIQLLKGTGVVGRMLLSYKSIQADQRTSIIGFTLIVLSIFAVIPGPIVFGSLFESACSVREDTCEGADLGNCWLYKDSTLRFAYNLGAAAFLVVAFALDALLWKSRSVHDLRIYDGELRHLTSQAQTPSTSGTSNQRFTNVSLTT